MDFVSAIFSKMVKDGLLAETSLLLLIIGLLFLLYIKVVAPMKNKIDKIPDMDDLIKYKSESNDIHFLKIEDLKERIDKINGMMESIEFLDKVTQKDVAEIREDVEDIKQMLNQFHGHLMYNNTQKVVEFGNKELK